MPQGEDGKATHGTWSSSYLNSARRGDYTTLISLGSGVLRTARRRSGISLILI